MIDSRGSFWGKYGNQTTETSTAPTTVKPTEPSKIHECQDGTNEWFHIISVDVDPWPICEKFTLNFQIELLQEIQHGTQLELQLTFITPGLGNLTIPCHGLSFCSYDMQTLLNETMHEDDREICNSVMPEGQDCNLPLKTGLYNTKGTYVLFQNLVCGTMRQWDS